MPNNNNHSNTESNDTNITVRRQRRHSAGDAILNHHHHSTNNRRSYDGHTHEQLEIEEEEPPAYTEVMEHDDSYRPKKRRRRRWSFTALMKRITPKLISLTRSNNNNSSTRSIRTVLSSRPTGDVLDEYQQQDILNQLHTMNDRQVPHPPSAPLLPPPHAFPFPVPSNSNNSHSRNSGGHRLLLRGGFQRGRFRSAPTVEGDDMRRIASLDRIWVFRLLLGPHGEEPEEEEENDSNNGTPMVWTTFDYDNQMILTDQQESEKGIEVFDSHIRQGQLPVLVIPKRQRGYFPMDRTGDAIITLEIACLPNTKDTLFVMRQYSP